MSSSATSSSSSSPEPSSPIKRKREPQTADGDSDSDDSNDSDAEPAEPDVPALSHAERRRQKKQEKLKAKQDQEKETVSKKRKLQDGTAASVSGKRQNSVWVGNLSFKTTQDDLRTFFDGAGEITRIYMPTKASTGPAGPSRKEENRGFAYVDFVTQEAKTAAIARSEQPLIGRKLLIKDGDDFTGRPAPAGLEGTVSAELTAKTHSKTAQKILRAQKQPAAPTLFIGNLGFEATEESIRGLFEAHRAVKKKVEDGDEGGGESEEKKDKLKDVWIRKVRMGTFEDTGLCKGFAFVDFLTTEYATEALINPKNFSLDGRKLVVEYAGADAVRRGAVKPGREDGVAPKPNNRDPQSRRSTRPQRSERQQNRQAKTHIETPVDTAVEVEAEDGERPTAHTRDTRKPGRDGKLKGPRNRPKPGAALALAKRESAAILPSQGQKITF